jgi:CheY-like chemotaxis protein
MDKCPRCGSQSAVAGYEDARTYFQCENCQRIWSTEAANEPAPSVADFALRVLVADDSEALAELVAMWLRDEGYRAVTATSGRQALDVAAIHHPDIALLDLVMPPPDGIAVCEALQRLTPAPEVILMTGISDPVRLARARDLGVAELLRKPLTSEAVLAAVASAAKRRRALERVKRSGSGV